ncbi:DUF4145 domain-containing protein [Aeromonas dhakensis]|uniref:DUF4145 domain-containing protein n=1 Tax=Aeromonas dhakensis TaxID=196024 RepID=UPI001CEFB9FF|nr:DUF4145 domain-containing protein [Aeromonas dhakensis]MDD9307510.1 DUF4145 domain-containing protein [Aeromonas hydrophila]UCM51565.1 DUF4145 domain-containing protein [Aeromonas dhakensis]WPS57446.1 DUF4145 domain-containing protein [Aeromonas dhakensis]WRT74966.1 DUF4145 domain-containing protein [Aeromonas dhakensis]CAD7491023.1 hypothetical protein KBAD45_17860 [Aeromonas dhakensis]
MSKYYPPTYEQKQFHCTHCGVYAKQEWHSLYISNHGGSDFTSSRCTHCWMRCYWYQDRMIVPSEAPVPPPHVDLPESCKSEYDEARDIVGRSPRAAAALLRLCVQKLMVELGEKGKNINDDIGALVKKGLPVEVQQALDYCRVIGNNGVHPGEIELTDNPEIAHSIFEMINFIVDDRISRPQKIAELYKTLPEGALKAVEKRDGNQGK